MARIFYSVSAPAPAGIYALTINPSFSAVNLFGDGTFPNVLESVHSGTITVPTSVPEPSALACASLGATMLGIATFLRRKHARRMSA